MKQFLTLCLATAMLGSSMNVDAKMTLERAMQLKSEGKALNSFAKVRDHQALKTLKAAPVSGFHKLMSQKTEKVQMQKAPGKVTAKGDNIYGWLGYGNDMETVLGLYEFNDGSQDLVWADELGAPMMNAGLQEGVIKGYAMSSFFGFILGVYYCEYDFETGEVINFLEQDLESNANYMQSMALNPETGEMYGFGGYDSGLAFIKSTTEDPFAYELVAPAEDMCISMCYNADDASFYGVTTDYRLVKIDEKTGATTDVMTLEVADGATYLTGLVYDPISKVFYWNINYGDDESALATIDPATKELDVYEVLDNGEEYMALFTTDEVANPEKPERPVAGAADFYKDNLIGFVSFTMPSEMSDGSAIPDSLLNSKGEMAYNAYVDKQFYSTGYAVPGEEVKINFAVPEDGMYTFGCAAVGTVPSAIASVKAYVGNDTPVAPGNVTLDATKVSWTPVTEGVHGGYIDVKAVTYDVTLNGEPVAAGLDYTVTEQAVNIDLDQEVTTYTAVVVATCNGKVSAEGSSNTIVEGAPMQLPVMIAPDPDQFAISTVLDGNEDGKTWSLASTTDGGYCIYSNWHSTNAMDEYFFLPPIYIEDVTKFYSFSMQAALYSNYYTNEYVEVIVCDQPNVSGSSVVGEIIPEFSPISTDFETARGEFRVRQAGTYYIAIHCTSDADQYGIVARNFTVEDNNITMQSPAEVDDLELVAGEKGALTATVNFTMPTMTVGGEELAADAKLTAYVNGAKGVKKGVPGEEVSIEIPTEQGNNEVSVVIAMGSFNSPAVFDNVYCGVVVPVPVDPETMTYEVTDDFNGLTMKWGAVTEGEDGGYVDPAEIVYDVYMYDSNYGWLLYDEGLDVTTYTYTTDIQDFVQLGVVPRNVAGYPSTLATVAEVVGPSIGLPIDEDFTANAGFLTNPWVLYVDDTSNAPSAGLYYANALGDTYPETDIVLVVQGAEGASGMLSTPKFTTAGQTTVSLTLDVCGDFFLPKVTIYAECEDVEQTAIGEIVQDEEGFHNVSVELPAEFLGKQRVGLYIGYEFESGDEIFAVKSLSIGSGSSVATLATQGVKVVGGKGVINVSGLNGQNVTVANLSGAVVAKSAKVSNASFEVEKGIYVVEAGDKKVKVVVK